MGEKTDELRPNPLAIKPITAPLLLGNHVTGRTMVTSDNIAIEEELMTP